MNQRLVDMLKRAYREEFISTPEVLARMLLRSVPRRLFDRVVGRYRALCREERMMALIAKRPTGG